MHRGYHEAGRELLRQRYIMKINEIGGEFALIDRLARTSPTNHKDLFKGIGDDAAVIRGFFPNQESLLVTTDMLVDNRHFRRDWATAHQIGSKAITCNASDIAAMGGTPTFLFVSIALTENTLVAWMDDLYKGMSEVCRQYGIVLAGGDTTKADSLSISITLLGRVAPQNLCLRSQARPDDLLCVTGPLGGSAAGLTFLTMGQNPPERIRAKHFMPGCRLDVSPAIAPLAGAMIDISDGLAAEVNHICNQSGTGAKIFAEKIPIDAFVQKAAALSGKTPIAYALSGGEDFELLFSISPMNWRQLGEKGVETFVVGRVTESGSGRVLVSPEGDHVPLTGGYNHFA